MSPIERICIENACSRLITEFALRIDDQRWDEVAELFTEDGEFDRQIERMKGKDAIVSWVNTIPRDVAMMHSYTNIVIDVISESIASGLCYFTVLRRPEGEHQPSTMIPISIGKFRDSFTLTADGWRFARRVQERFAPPLV